MITAKKKYVSTVSTRNACKLCAPLGASLVFKGIAGCLPMIHGSQGCATYIRRYLISHYKEPMDIASSNFSEESTIFGGNKNFNTSIDNIIKQYHPEVIGIATSCLSETIGEDVARLIHEFKSVNAGKEMPVFVHASTPSYNGTHMDGFHEAVASTVSKLASWGNAGNHINIFSGFVSPEDIRHLKDIMRDFENKYVLFPDYSDTLDNPNWKEYQIIPEGGTTIDEIKKTGYAKASFEFGYVLNKGATGTNKFTAAEWLEQNRSVPKVQLGLPVGIKETDRFFEKLEAVTERKTPERYQRQRGRLVDAYIDGHKYLFGKRAIVYGEEDMVIGIVSFLEEIGIETVLAVSGGESGAMKAKLEDITGGKRDEMIVLNGSDFETIDGMADELRPDIMIGHSKGYYIARRLGIPLVRIGFPVHDRFGAQCMQHLCYQGTHQLFNRITNALIEYKQDNSPVGYKYI